MIAGGLPGPPPTLQQMTQQAAQPSPTRAMWERWGTVTHHPHTGMDATCIACTLPHSCPLAHHHPCTAATRLQAPQRQACLPGAQRQCSHRDPTPQLPPPPTHKALLHTTAQLQSSNTNRNSRLHSLGDQLGYGGFTGSQCSEIHICHHASLPAHHKGNQGRWVAHTKRLEGPATSGPKVPHHKPTVPHCTPGALPHTATSPKQLSTTTTTTTTTT